MWLCSKLCYLVHQLPLLFLMYRTNYIIASREPISLPGSSEEMASHPGIKNIYVHNIAFLGLLFEVECYGISPIFIPCEMDKVLM